MKRLLMTGAGGLLGTALRARLLTEGFEVVILHLSLIHISEPTRPY